MSGRGNKATKVEPTQLTEYAFNIAGHAMKHGIEGRENYLLISATEVSSKQWKLELKHIGEGTGSVASIPMTAKEQEEPEVGAARYLVVGIAAPLKYYVSGNVDGQADISKAVKKAGIPGTSVESELELRDSEQRYLAVVPLYEEEPSKLLVYVLLGPRKHGLLRPHVANQDEVFYFSEFRDDSKSIQKRRLSWNKLILNKALGLAANKKAMSAKQLRFRAARDTTKVILEPNQSFRNEVLLLTRGFARTKDPWFLDELVRVLKDADDDNNFAPPPSNIAMHNYVIKSSSEFKEEDAKVMVEELRGIWPELKDVTADRLIWLKVGLDETRQILEYRFLRGVVAEGCSRLARQEAKESRVGEPIDLVILQELIYGLVETVARVLETGSQPVAPIEEEQNILAVVFSKLKEMKKASDVFNKKLKASNGDQVRAASVPEIWTLFAKALDQDSAKLAFNQVVRSMMAAYASKDAGLGGMIDDLVDVMVHLGVEADVPVEDGQTEEAMAVEVAAESSLAGDEMEEDCHT